MFCLSNKGCYLPSTMKPAVPLGGVGVLTWVIYCVLCIKAEHNHTHTHDKTNHDSVIEPKRRNGNTFYWK